MTRLSHLAMTLALTFIVNAAHAQFDNLPKDTNNVTAKPSDPAAANGENIGPKLEKPIVQVWRTGVTIRAIGGPVGGLTGTFPIPIDWPEQQVKLVDQQNTPQVGRIGYRETDGVLKQALFNVPTIQANDMARVELVFQVTNHTQIAPTDTTGYVIPEKPATTMKKFLSASPFIEINNQKLKLLVKEATEGKETAWEQVEALYDTVKAKITLERSREGKFVGSTGAINNGKADKEDLTSAFVAACRVHKVPARMVWIPDSCYAEFYLEKGAGGAWFPAQLVGDKQFGGLIEPKPILQKGDNLRVPENKEAQRFVSEFLTGKGKQGGRPDVEFMRRLE
jgi:hypothetical protein